MHRGDLSTHFQKDRLSKSEEYYGIYVGGLYWGVSRRPDGEKPDAFGSAFVKLD
jgi:hypothetical protein